MNSIRKITFFAIAVLLIAGLSACDELVTILSDDEMSAQLPDEIEIGIVLPFSGKYVTGPDDPTIQRYLNGFLMARDEINAAQLAPPRLRFIIEDDQSTIEGALAAYNKLIHEDGVAAILGPSSSTQVEMAFPVAEANRLVAIGPSSAAQGLSGIGDYVFRVNQPVDKIIPRGVRLTHERLGYQRVAKLVTSDDVYSTSADSLFAESLDATGVEVLSTETALLRAGDYTAQLARIKALNPDAIFVSAQPLDMPDIMIQARQIGIGTDIPIIAPLLSSTEVQEAGDAAKGTITFTSWSIKAETPRNKAFVRNFRAKYELEPNLFSALAYTSVYLLTNAISNAGSIESDAVRDALAETEDFDTVLGSFSFDAVGDPVYDPIMLIVRDGGLEAFE